MKAGNKEERSWAGSQRSWLGLLVFLLLLAVSAVDAQADFALDWFSVDGGGGTSTGGVYSVSGTVGQADAGVTMSGGNYSLTGGFWSLIATVRAPGMPALTIARSGNRVTVSWPSPSTGWTLQQATDLGVTNWSTSDLPISDDGSAKSVTIVSPTGDRFFRLIRL